MKSLLEKAVAISTVRSRTNSSDDEQELAIAWAKQDISLKQVSGALGMSRPGNTYVFLALALRASVISGKLRNGEDK